MLSNRMEYMLIFFDVFGYNTGATKLSNYQRAASFILITHVLMLVYFTYAKVHLAFELLALYQILDVINFLLQFSAGLYTYWIIIFDSVLYRKDHQNFWEIISKINSLCTPQNRFTFRCYLLKLWEYFSFTIVCVVVMISESGVQLSKIAFLYHVIVKICEVRIFYYIFCLEIFHFHLTTINNDLRKNKKKLHFLIKTHRLKWIREYYSYVHQMTSYFNEVFSWSQMAVISFCFCLICSTFNWIYVHYKDLSIIHSKGKFHHKNYLYK